MRKEIATLLFALLAVPGAQAQIADWQSTWEKTLGAAKSEGKVVVIGSPDPVMRNEVIPKFQARFGITIEYVAGSSSQLAARVRTERSVGIYAVDAFLSGIDTSKNVLYAQKMIDPLKPLLFLPDVTDGKNWKRGSPWFVDGEEQYILALFSSIDTLVFINTDYVKPEEMRSAKDLLNPKWRGKITAEDPNDTGSGNATAIHYYTQLGSEFLQNLYIGQRITLSHDGRQTADWLARGTYPICLTCRGDGVIGLQKDGFKLLGLFEFSDMMSHIKLSPFVLTLANKAPHPNAARIFVNWMASKEALEIYSRHWGVATLRGDMDESFLEPSSIPRPGVKYFDTGLAEWLSKGRAESAAKVRELLKNP